MISMLVPVPTAENKACVYSPVLAIGGKESGLAVMVLLLCQLTTGLIWPGLAPREYKDGETVPMLANKLSSVRTQIPRSFWAPRARRLSTESNGRCKTPHDTSG